MTRLFDLLLNLGNRVFENNDVMFIMLKLFPQSSDRTLDDVGSIVEMVTYLRDKGYTKPYSEEFNRLHDVLSTESLMVPVDYLRSLSEFRR